MKDPWCHSPADSLDFSWLLNTLQVGWKWEKHKRLCFHDFHGFAETPYIPWPSWAGTWSKSCDIFRDFFPVFFFLCFFSFFFFRYIFPVFFFPVFLVIFPVFFCNFSRWFCPFFFPVFLVFFSPFFCLFFHRFIYFSLLFFFPLVFSRFFSTILFIFPFLGFDCFNWYLQHFAIKLSDLHGACYIWSLDPPGAWYFEYQGPGMMKMVTRWTRSSRG